MPRPKPDPDMVAHAVAQVTAGHSCPEVAKELQSMGYRISASAVRNWVRDAGAPASDPVRLAPRDLSTALQARREAKPADAAPALDVSDTLGTLRTIVEGMLKESHDAKLSNPKLAATLAKSAGELMNTILRGEKTRAEDLTTLRISRAEIDETWRALLDRLRTLTTERPLLCAHCNRKLSIAWGEAEEKVAEALKGTGT